MKKLFTLMILLVIMVSAQSQVFGEFFMNQNNNDFWPVQTLIKSNPDMIAVMHFEPKTQVGDTLYNRQSTDRRRWLGSNNIPCGYINGTRMSNLLDSTKYQTTETFDCDIEIEGSFQTNIDMQTELSWIIYTGKEGLMVIYLTENKCYGNWPNGNYQNVMLQMIEVEGSIVTNKLSVNTIFENTWNADSVSLVVVVYNNWGKVIGAKKMPLKASVTTGIISTYLKDVISVFPNPTANELYIDTQKPIDPGNIKIINTLGQFMIVDMVEKNKLDVRNLASGLYWINFTVDKQVHSLRFIKQ